MGDVVKLSHFQNQDTVALLRALTIAAVNGDVIGLDAHIRMRGGREMRACSGPYLRSREPDSTDGTSGK